MAEQQRPRVERRRRQIEVFSAGCYACNETVQLVEQLAGPDDDVQVLDLKDEKVAAAARGLGVRSVPAVVITASRLAPCCSSGPGPDEAVLREAGIGVPLQIEGRRRQIEIFSAGCSMCREVIELVQRMACHSCDVQILDMNDENVARLAKSLGIRSVPAVVITASELAPCCAGKRGPDEAVLRQAGIGQPINR